MIDTIGILFKALGGESTHPPMIYNLCPFQPGHLFIETQIRVTEVFSNGPEAQYSQSFSGNLVHEPLYL